MTDFGCICDHCKTEYSSIDNETLDLRLKKQKKIDYTFTVNTPLLDNPDFKFEVLLKNNRSEVDFRNVNIPHHLTEEIMSYFPKAKTSTSFMLDLGCGSTTHREVCEHAGFSYIGLDYASEEAQILGDAHSLPFKDNSFEFVLSIAVLEHIQYPFLMMKEVNRVLKPDGIFIGTVAFLEPFHANSYYHHTHLGTYNSLKEGGFDIQYIAPSKEWSVLIAQSKILFPKIPRFIAKLLVLPLYMAHRLWWGFLNLFTTKSLEKIRILKTTGAFSFVAKG
jgi:SAM-dependent methyltransferase